MDLQGRFGLNMNFILYFIGMRRGFWAGLPVFCILLAFSAIRSPRHRTRWRTQGIF